MGWISKLLSRKAPVAPAELTKPFLKKAHEALRNQELNKAIAYLNRGLELVPDDLNLHLQRAQVFQYGLGNYSKALEGYRFILLKIESQPDADLEEKCKAGMRDMMDQEN